MVPRIIVLYPHFDYDSRHQTFRKKLVFSCACELVLCFLLGDAMFKIRGWNNALGEPWFKHGQLRTTEAWRRLPRSDWLHYSVAGKTTSIMKAVVQTTSCVCRRDRADYYQTSTTRSLPWLLLNWQLAGVLYVYLSLQCWLLTDTSR